MITSTVHETFSPIFFSAREVAKMAQLANEFGPDFCRAATPHLSPAFIGYHLDQLVSEESPEIPRSIQNALNLKPNHDGGFTWLPR